MWRTLVPTIVAVSLSIAMVASCSQEEPASGGAEQAAAPAAGGEQAAAPAAPAAAPAAPAAAPAAPAGNPCDGWATCCNAYAKAMESVSGFETSAKAQSDTCKQIDAMRNGPSADQACTNAWSAMKRVSGMVKSAPGFVWPTVCD